MTMACWAMMRLRIKVGGGDSCGEKWRSDRRFSRNTTRPPADAASRNLGRKTNRLFPYSGTSDFVVWIFGRSCGTTEAVPSRRGRLVFGFFGGFFFFGFLFLFFFL